MTFILKKEILLTTKRNRVINYILLKEKVEIPLKNKTCTYFTSSSIFVRIQI
jgi:hypothetical protein